MATGPTAELLNPRNTLNSTVRDQTARIMPDAYGIVTLAEFQGSRDFTEVGPTIQSVIPRDANGNEAEVTQEKELRVASFSGTPLYGIDVAGADTYTTIVTTARRCHNLWVTVATKAAILSLNGGLNDHFWLPLGVSVLFTGLDIPAGSAIQMKNETAGQNYANGTVSVW